jgi:hypothetical protein
MRTGAPATCRGARGGGWRRGKGAHTSCPTRRFARNRRIGALSSTAAAEFPIEEESSLGGDSSFISDFEEHLEVARDMAG